MDKVSMFGLGEIKTKKYGTVKILKRKDVCNAYFVIGKTGKGKVIGLISKDNKEIIPFCEAVLEDYHINSDNKNAYLGFKYKDCPNTEYYIIKEFDKEPILVTKFLRDQDVPITFGKTNVECNVWPIEIHTNPSSYMLYNFVEGRTITLAVDCLLDVKEKNLPHKFYYEINIASSNEAYDGKKIYIVHSKLCGYLDENGYMSSHVLDSDSLLTYKFEKKLATNSKEFKNFIGQIVYKYKEEYNDKEDKILDSMQKLLSSEDPYVEKTKIIEFNNTRRKV